MDWKDKLAKEWYQTKEKTKFNEDVLCIQKHIVGDVYRVLSKDSLWKLHAMHFNGKSASFISVKTEAQEDFIWENVVLEEPQLELEEKIEVSSDLKKFINDNGVVSEVKKINIDFGVVENYFIDKGYGFVSSTLSDSFGGVFFHIKNIKRSNIGLAKSIKSEESLEAINFWYEFEITHRGVQVKSIIDPGNIQEQFKAELPVLIEKIEGLWHRENSYESYLEKMSQIVLGSERTLELKNKRLNKEIEAQQERLKKLKRLESLSIIEREKQSLYPDAELRCEIVDIEHRLFRLEGKQEIHDNEYKLLLAEIAPLGFTHSKELSKYIMNNSLKEKYKNISGVVKMEAGGEIWDFSGGFPRHIYARLCRELSLENAGSSAKPISFCSFSELENK
jgi:hypothetical protein